MPKNKSLDIGILDPTGINKNPLTGKKYSTDYIKYAKVWSKLPAYKTAKPIINDIINNQILLVVSGTGSGKTVLIPKYVLHAFNYDCKIAVTLPKQKIAYSSAEYAAKTLDVKLGNEIGYKFKGSPNDSFSSDTKILYATDGTIVANLINDPLLSKYDAIIIDEAHERKVQIDFLLYLLREVIKNRAEFKLIIMSATISTDIFIDYFKEFKIKQLNLSGDANFPIKSIFTDISSKENYNKILTLGFNTLIQILDSEKNNKESENDIIFFVSSQSDTTTICDMLNKYIENCKDKECEIIKHGDIYCATIYSSLNQKYVELVTSENKYLKLKSPKTKYYRKVVIATNVAESSLTIKGLTYVIDSGYELESSYDSKFRAKILNKSLISVAQAKQRMGRTGRTKPGTCYHLYSNETFTKIMKKYPEPAIRKTDITMDMLRLLSVNSIQTCKKLSDALNNFIEPPSSDNILHSMNYLMGMNLISDDRISTLGSYISNLGVNTILFGLCISYGILNKCSYEMAIIITIMSEMKMNVNKLFVNQSSIVDKKNLKARIKQVKKNMFHYYGDHITILKIYQDYTKAKNKEKWCTNNFFNRSLFDIENKKLFKKLKHAKINEYIKMDDSLVTSINKLNLEDRILTSLILSHRMNTAIKSSNKNKYFTQSGYSDNLKLSRSSFVEIAANESDIYPKNIFYSELFINDGRAELNFVGIIPDKIIELLK